MCEGCAYYINNWFYGYQTYCSKSTEYWLNPLGWILIIILICCFIYLNFYLKENKEDD